MTHLSRYFETKRKAKQLSPGELARLAGCQNISKSGNKIRQFEMHGTINRELFEKIAAVLEVEQNVIEKLVEQDRQEQFAAWLEWVNTPIKPYLVIRLMAAVYSQRAVPSSITTQEEAEKWAAGVAVEIKRRCCLVWNRRVSIWFAEDGSLEQRTETGMGEPNMPYVQVGGKKFLFGEGLGSAVVVDLRPER
ncbi:MAG: hypothetical protein KatS3mg105_0186 [Gemmatales bacterium]|nr:MAG: hypothetical protein KatS3mg105_0186 [Gemmatales bacterium]